MNHTRNHQPAGTPTLPGPVFLLFVILAVFASIPAVAATLDLAPGWNLITATPDFAGSLPDNLEILEFADGSYTTVAAQDAVPGRAYWLYTESAQTLAIPESEISENTVSVDLAPGWNLVGNPFRNPAAPSLHAFVSLDEIITIFSESDAVEPHFITFDPATSEYARLAPEASLAPFRGYLVRARKPCTLIITRPGPQDPSSATRVTVRPFHADEITVDAATGHRIAGREIMVQMPAGTSPADAETQIAGLGGVVAGRIPGLNLLQVVIPENSNPSEFGRGVTASISHADAATNPIFEMSGLPDDPVFADTDAANDYQFAAINALTVFESSPPSPAAPVLAILDTGLDSAHEEFTGRLLAGYDFIANGTDTTDRNGHGTQAAGLAAAAGNNGVGTAGVCWTCRIMPVRILDDRGRTTAFTVLAGIMYAADHGARVINLSLSGPNDHGLWEQKFGEAAAYARSKGAVVVAAAGNNGAEASEYLPGAASGIITVGATDSGDARAVFSNYGPSVRIAAPGERLYTTAVGGYTWMNGTSAAAPLATGAAGVLFNANPGWTPSQVETALANTARPVATDQPLGAGIIDLTAAAAWTGSGTSSGGGTETGGNTGAGTGTDPGMGAAAAHECIVKTTIDDNSTLNTLRSCIKSSNFFSGSDRITFELPLNSTIFLQSELPPLVDYDGVEIDGGTTQVIINGNNANLESKDGIRILSSNNTIKNISLVRFHKDPASPDDTLSAGIRITDKKDNGDPLAVIPENNQILNCRIGTNFNDTTNMGNSVGIVLEGKVQNNSIKDTWVSRSFGHGIVISDGSRLNVIDNTRINSNESNGVVLRDLATTNTIQKSMIYGNLKNGILIRNSVSNRVYGSFIGAYKNGAEYLDNEMNGISIEGGASVGNQIGGMTTSNLGNVISGNALNGIYINDGNNNLIYGNIIGLEGDGQTIMANSYNGIYLTNNAISNQIGDTDPAYRNIISGNAQSGILIDGTGTNGTIILSNYIGLTRDGRTERPNGGVAGIYINKSPNNVIGVGSGDTPAGNVIIGNKSQSGIRIDSSNGNLIQFNRIGIDPFGNYIGVFDNAIWIRNSSSTVIGAKQPDKNGDNIIVNSGKNGISVYGSGSLNNKFFKNSIYDNTMLAIALDAGTNNNINAPVISNVQYTGPSGGLFCYNVTGTKAANTYAHIYLADNRSVNVKPDPSGYGEGYTYVGRSSSAYTSTSFVYNSICVSECHAFSAVASDDAGNTSEFGKNIDMCTGPEISSITLTPATVVDNGFQKVRVTAKILYANGLDKITSVKANLSEVNRPASTSLFDDGFHGDGAKDDGVYGSELFTVPEGVPGGAKNIPVTVAYTLGSPVSAAGTLTVRNIAKPQACGRDWPSFACNNANTGQSTQSFKWPLKPKWKNDTDFNSIIYTSPIIVGNHIYVAEKNGYAYAIDKSNGHQIWKSPYLGDLFQDNAPAIWNNWVIFAGYSGRIFALDRFANGTVAWSPSLVGGNIAGSSPVVDNDLIYVGSKDGKVYALNPIEKKVEWSYPSSSSSEYSFGEAPVSVVNGIVYAGNIKCIVYAIDAFTGEKYWERQVSTDNKCQIIGAGTTVTGDLVCTATFGTDMVYCLNKYSGAVQWSKHSPEAMMDSHGAIYNNQYIVGTYDASTGVGSLYAYDINNSGNIIWRATLGENLIHSSPAVFNDYIYVTAGNNSSDQGGLYVIDPNQIDVSQNAAVVWHNDLKTFITSNPAVTDDLIVFGTAFSSPHTLYGFGPGSLYECPNWTVTNNNPAGPGSLFDCIGLANESTVSNTIDFDPLVHNTTIKPVNPLIFEQAGGAVILKGTGTNIVIDGQDCPNCNGFEINADGSRISGLAIVQYKNHHGIDISAQNVTIDGCRVGTNFSDSSVLGNSGGIYISGQSNSVINSVISGNTGTGITLDGANAMLNAIQRNKIGTSANGMNALPNKGGGILLIDGASNNLIGGNESLNQGNVISGNALFGIKITDKNTTDKCSQNAIQDNLIGLNAAQSGKLANPIGIMLMAGADKTIIGGGTDYANVISGNTSVGLYVESAGNNTITGNRIGLTRDALTPFGNTGIGLYLNEAHNSVVGDKDVGTGNYIGANGAEGIYIINTNNLSLLNNRIGVKADLKAAGNAKDGLFIATNVSQIAVGDATGHANVIAYNGGDGVEITGLPAYVVLSGNSIYENAGKGIVSARDYQLKITAISKSGSNYNISGTSTCPSCLVELFRVDDSDALVGQDNATTPAAGEGFEFASFTLSTNTGAWSFTALPISSKTKYVTATVRTGPGTSTTPFATNFKLPESKCPDWKVTTVNDNGVGSLRECLNEANKAGGNKTITFDGSIQNGIITPQGELPVFGAPNITVDGGSQNITIDGGYPCIDCHGFVLRNDGGGVKNLTIINFNTSNKSGIVIDGQLGKGDNYIISGNKIGTDGTSAKPNKYGVSIVLGGDHNTIQGNIISGNTEFGINIIGAGSNYNFVYGNVIGFASNGTTPVPNLDNGIHIGNQASHNKIGGTTPSLPNRIGHNGKRGIHISASTCTNNTVTQNVIYNNTQLGIDLAPGANGGVTPPIIDKPVVVAPQTYMISGSTSPLCDTCTVEIFLADYTGIPGVPQENFDSPAAGEAYSYLATAVTDDKGKWALSSSKTITSSKYITATLTDHNENTSMFAANRELKNLLCPDLKVTSYQDSGFGSLRECIKQANSDGLESDITFTITNQTITLTSALPPLLENRTTIKNTTGTRITIDGGKNAFGCFSIQSSGDQIRGLTIVNCGNATTGHAIEITGGDAFLNTIAGNFIGTNSDDATGLGNHTGILIKDDAHLNTIGGKSVADRNIISANTAYGIRITDDGSDANNVFGNFIGSKTNGEIANDLKNKTGISIESGAAGNKIGGTDIGSRNLIINSSANGVQITGSGTTGNKVIGNRIYENGGLGISLSAGGNNNLATPQISTPTKASFTTYNISGITSPSCAGCTVELYRADDTATSVQHDAAGGEGFQSVATTTTSTSGTWSFQDLSISGGDYVSATVTDANGNTSPFAIDRKLPSSNCPGLVVTTNTETGFGSLRECIIAANTDNVNSNITFDNSMAGKTITLTQSLPTIQQNPDIATSYTTIQNTTGGTVTINGGGGSYGCINIASANNRIRGLTIVNCGSGQNGHGIGIAGAANINNEIAGNVIGTNASGAGSLGNSIGIRIDGSSLNIIGGTTEADRNIISGNLIGLNLNFSSHDNTVTGNYFGTNPGGTAKVANTAPVSAGIVISNSSYKNIIGGNTSAKRNIISGTTYGIIIQQSGSNENTVIGNYIGSDKNGNYVSGLQNGTGIKIETAAKNNTVGGDQAGEPNLIVFNDINGVLVKEAGTTGNKISQNRIYRSGGKGIVLESSGNGNLAPPHISAVSVTAPNKYRISGNTAPVCANCTVELFRADYTGSPSVGADAAGGEAHAFVFATSTDINGQWVFNDKTITDGKYVTTTLTDTSGNTSEFSQNKLLNGDPVITSLTSTSRDISFYDVITLAAAATDPDGDPLTYEWSGGDPNPFSATTSASTQWTAPRDAYIATMTVTVRDGRGGMTSATITVRVGIKDIQYIVAYPLTLSIPVNISHTYKIQALFSTGETFNVRAESAAVLGGKGTVDVNGTFTATAAGDDTVVFSIGDHQDTAPVTIY